MRPRLTFQRAAATVLLLLGLAAPARADYPDKTIRMIVSIAAGSVTDVIMRAAANELTARLGQPIVIENRGGAAGIPAGQACAQAAPDGYTICVIFHNTLSFNPVMFSNLPYDADKDFALITRLFFLIESLAVTPSLPVKSVAELKALAQAKSRPLNYGTLGAGSAPELFLTWLNNEWKSQIVGVPYRGGGPIAQALAAGDIEIGSVGLGNFLALAQAGKLRLLAVASPKRSPLVPDVPTFEEAGISYKWRGWWGLAAPKGTPQPILDRLGAEFVKLFSDPKFVTFLDNQAVVAAPTSPGEFAAFVREDRLAAAALIKLANTPREEYKPER